MGFYRNELDTICISYYTCYTCSQSSIFNNVSTIKYKVL